MPPSPRFDHAAAVHGERYLLIFGGSSHATCFNDLHVLDLRTVSYIFLFITFVDVCLHFTFSNKTELFLYFITFIFLQMEWSIPTQKGEVPSPRAVHAGATIGESWFIAGGDNEIGMFLYFLFYI